MPKPKAKSEPKAEPQPIPVDITNPQFWRALAREVIDQPDGWPVMEVATALCESCILIGKHWRKFSSLIDGVESSDGQFSITVAIDRSETPSEVTTGIRYNQVFSDKVSVKTPDPEQLGLPLTVEETARED